MAQNYSNSTALNIFSFSEDRSIIVNQENLDKIFDHSEIKNRKVVILSVIGAFRGGKSFFLDYCLRFLYANYQSIENRGNSNQEVFRNDSKWMGEATTPLNGFSWSSGCFRNTTGIIMWSDVFLHTLEKTGEKIAIFVMDTQGLFDNQATQADNSRIFALGSLLSSISVFNVLGRIQGDQLDFMQFATKLPQNVVDNEETQHKPLQSVVFLVRDWTSTKDFDYGFGGGEMYLEYILNSNPNENAAVETVRDTIYGTFEDVKCFLMPHPGEAVTSDRFEGEWKDMKTDFKNNLQHLINFLLTPNNLIIKKINGDNLTVLEMKNLFQQCSVSLNNNDDLGAFSLYELTVRGFMNGVILRCVENYKNERLQSNMTDLIQLHATCKQNAINKYNEERKMGTSDYINECREDLIREIDKTHDEFHLINEEIRHQLERELQQKDLQMQGLITELGDTVRRLRVKELQQKVLLFTIATGVVVTGGAYIVKKISPKGLESALIEKDDDIANKIVIETGSKILHEATTEGKNHLKSALQLPPTPKMPTPNASNAPDVNSGVPNINIPTLKTPELPILKPEVKIPVKAPTISELPVLKPEVAEIPDKIPTIPEVPKPIPELETPNSAPLNFLSVSLYTMGILVTTKIVNIIIEYISSR